MMRPCAVLRPLQKGSPVEAEKFLVRAIDSARVLVLLLPPLLRT
jgi:hypothetical protein